MANEELKEKNVKKALQTAYELYTLYGIESTTKLMIAEASGLSRPSIDRYFSSKTDCVIQAAKYVAGSVRIIENYSDTLFTDGKHTGRDLLLMYISRARDLYKKDPQLFILRNEYKQYIYRHFPDFDQGYNILLDALECKSLIKRIFALGIQDHSLPDWIVPEFEADYFCESFLGFLGSIALVEHGGAKKTLPVIDKYIERIMKLY